MGTRLALARAMTLVAETPGRNTPDRSGMRAAHAALDEQMHVLARVADAGDGPSLVAPWRAFEAALGAHLALEENELFPKFAVEDAREVDALRAEHAAIRARVDDLALRVELHTLRAVDVHALVAALRAHAAREDALFYAWLDERRAR